MMRTGARMPFLLTLGTVLFLTAACSGESAGTKAAANEQAADGPVVAVATTWEGALAKAAGAGKVVVIMPPGATMASPTDDSLSVIDDADFVLFSATEPFAAQLKSAADEAESQPLEVTLDNDPAALKAQVDKLAAEFETEDAADDWKNAFDAETRKLTQELRTATRATGKAPTAVAQVCTGWAATLLGAAVVGTYGPQAATPAQVAQLSVKGPGLVLGNASTPQGAAPPVPGAKQVNIVNVPGQDLDLLNVYRNAAAELKKAVTTP
ncbi:ABC transporter substrate-binding protein [Streptomyces sp. NPDC059917]|uniref:ABC transporter substrate-binding protein n=1 Tax=Streptomyces sp. NPDC059917 TaxID=3347002 RepID=UPI00365051F8